MWNEICSYRQKERRSKHSINSHSSFLIPHSTNNQIRFLKSLICLSFFILHSSFLSAQTITFTGDILLDRGVRQHIEQYGVDALFTPEIDSLFAASDVVVGNLECPATNLRTPASKLYVFRAEPEWLAVLRRHGITHLNLANNHTVDQHRGGLRSTYDNCLRAGIVPVGAGETMNQAADPVLLSGISNQKPSSLGEEGRGGPQRNIWLFASQRLKLENFVPLPDAFSVSQEDMDTLCQRISRLRTADPTAYIIVSLHWGHEHRLQPVPQQRLQAHQIIDAGADCIVAHHTHTLQTIETYKGKTIYYSIGNFIFDLTKPINTRACVVQITIPPHTAPADGNTPPVEVKTIPIEIIQCTPHIRK